MWKYIEDPKSKELPSVPALVPGANKAEVKAAEEALDKWQDRDLAAIIVVAAMLPRTTSIAVKHAKSAREMWEILREKY